MGKLKVTRAQKRKIQKQMRQWTAEGKNQSEIWQLLKRDGIKMGKSTVGLWLKEPLAPQSRKFRTDKKKRAPRKKGQISFADLETKNKTNDIYVELQPMLMQRFVDRKLLEREMNTLSNTHNYLSQRLDLSEKQIVKNRTFSDNTNDKLLGFLIWNVGLTIVSFALFARSQGWI